jgi:hypothetical protein
VLVNALLNVYALGLGPEVGRAASRLQDAGFEDEAGAVVVAGCLVAFAPGVSALHQRDVEQSLLLAQLAANAKTERHKDPAAWFRNYRSVLEQTAWVVESSTAASRFLPSVARYGVGNVVNDAFRRRVAADELGYLMAAVNAARDDPDGTAAVVFECPSHSGGIGNFQVVLAAETDGVLGMRIGQISFNAPQHVTRLLKAEFSNPAQFQVAFLELPQNEPIYAGIRNSIASKVESRFAGSVAPLQLQLA